jgi:DDE superfamily endonuclease
VNATGTDRWEPLYIGHAFKPRSFNKKTGEQLGFFYLHNKKAWMTGTFFETYLRRFNSYIGRTKHQKVLLLIDNAPSHIFSHLDLAYLEILPLPPNTTSVLQPLDAGIISSFKRHYRRRQLQHAVDQCDKGSKHPYKVEQLDAMRWIKAAWNAIDQSVFVNCWRHTTLLQTGGPPIAPSTFADNAVSDSEINGLFSDLRLENPMSIENFLNPVGEDNSTDRILTDQELIESVGVDDEEEPTEEEEEEEEEIIPFLRGISKADQIKAFAVVNAVYEERGLDYSFLKSLRSIQMILRSEVWLEREERQEQTLITKYFH